MSEREALWARASAFARAGDHASAARAFAFAAKNEAIPQVKRVLLQKAEDEQKRAAVGGVKTSSVSNSHSAQPKHASRSNMPVTNSRTTTQNELSRSSRVIEGLEFARQAVARDSGTNAPSVETVDLYTRAIASLEAAKPSLSVCAAELLDKPIGQYRARVAQLVAGVTSSPDVDAKRTSPSPQTPLESTGEPSSLPSLTEQEITQLLDVSQIEEADKQQESEDTAQEEIQREFNHAANHVEAAEARMFGPPFGEAGTETEDNAALLAELEELMRP